MRLKSRGLGRKELVMDFREYSVTRDGDEIVISGTIREPVHWEFSIRMCQDDLPGIVKLAGKRQTLGFFLKSALTRNKSSHWSVSREEHLKELKEAAQKEKAAKAAEKAAEKGKAAPKAKEDAGAKSDSDAAAKPAEAQTGSSDRAAKLAAAKAAAAKAKEGAAATATATAASKPATASPSTPGGKTVSFARPGSTPAAAKTETGSKADDEAKTATSAPGSDDAKSSAQSPAADDASGGAGSGAAKSEEKTELESTSERNAS